MAMKLDEYELVRNDQPARLFGADSDEVAQGFRFDGTHHSEMMSPSTWSLAGG
jgi:hypothetical protein